MQVHELLNFFSGLMYLANGSHRLLHGFKDNPSPWGLMTGSFSSVPYGTLTRAALSVIPFT